MKKSFGSTILPAALVALGVSCALLLGPSAFAREIRDHRSPQVTRDQRDVQVRDHRDGGKGTVTKSKTLHYRAPACLGTLCW